MATQAINPRYIPNQVKNGTSATGPTALVEPGEKVVVEEWRKTSYGPVRRMRKGVVKKINAKSITINLREVCKATGAVRYTSKPVPTQFVWRQDWED